MGINEKTMQWAKDKMTKRQTTIYKTQHRKLKMDTNLTKKWGEVRCFARIGSKVFRPYIEGM